MIVEQQNENNIKYEDKLNLLQKTLDLIKNEKDKEKILAFLKENEIINLKSETKTKDELISEIKNLRKKINPSKGYTRRIREDYYDILENKLAIDQEKINRIMGEYDVDEIQAADKEGVKKYIDYTSLASKVASDLKWYSRQINKAPKILEEIEYYLSKIFEGVDPTGNQTFDMILAIKSAAEFAIRVINMAWSSIQNSINHYYGMVIPYFALLTNKLHKRENMISIIVYIKYVENEIVNKNIYGIYWRIIYDNLRGYIKDYYWIFKIAKNKEFTDSFFSNKY
ncbi:hypothetical protein [Metamycoplasma equirhinis]|uniref:hypothetical protein n=1 Tax=Metamycoplasma equirhinis TaxID=92402 RepID=UPI00359490AE